MKWGVRTPHFLSVHTIAVAAVAAAAAAVAAVAAAAAAVAAVAAASAAYWRGLGPSVDSTAAQAST